MSKYIKLEDAIRNINLEVTGRKEYTGDMKANLFFALDDLPTIEVSEDNQVLYGTAHNCILTMFGECSYNETGCSDCAVAEKIRKALSVEVSEDCISKAYLEQEIENQIMPAIDREMYWRGWNNALGKVVELIEDAPSVVPSRAEGEWLLDGRCSECLVSPLTTHKNYCPNCGARMKGSRR